MRTMAEEQMALNLMIYTCCVMIQMVNIVADMRWRILYKGAIVSITHVGIRLSEGNTLSNWLFFPSIVGQEASPVALARSDSATLAAQGLLEKIVREHVVVEAHAAKTIACWRKGVL